MSSNCNIGVQVHKTIQQYVISNSAFSLSKGLLKFDTFRIYEFKTWLKSMHRNVCMYTYLYIEFIIVEQYLS